MVNPTMKAFATKLKRCNINAGLTTVGDNRRTSQTKLYKKLGLESLKFRHE